MSPHSLSFPALRSLRITQLPKTDESRREFNRRRFRSDGIIQLMQAAPFGLASLSLPALKIDAEMDFTNAFRRFAGSLTALTLVFQAIAAKSPLHSILADCSSLTSLNITLPSLSLLRQLISQLPKSTLTSLNYSSQTPCFLESFPNAAKTWSDFSPSLNSLSSRISNSTSWRTKDTTPTVTSWRIRRETRMVYLWNVCTDGRRRVFKSKERINGGSLATSEIAPLIADCCAGVMVGSTFSHFCFSFVAHLSLLVFCFVALEIDSMIVSIESSEQGRSTANSEEHKCISSAIDTQLLVPLKFPPAHIQSAG